MEHASISERARDCLLKSWNLIQLFCLNTLRGTFLGVQGCNVLLLAAAPQNFDACNRSGYFSVLLGRVKDKEPDGIITSSLKIPVGENTTKPVQGGANLDTSWHTSSNYTGDRETIIQQFRLLGRFNGNPRSPSHFSHSCSDVLCRRKKRGGNQINQRNFMPIGERCKPRILYVASRNDR